MPLLSRLVRFVLSLGRLLLRMLLAILLTFVPAVLVQRLLSVLSQNLGIDRATNPLIDLLIRLIAVTVLCLSYAAYVRWLERRPATELSRAGAVQEFGRGLLLGSALFTLALALIAVLGGYSVSRYNPSDGILPDLSSAITASFFEEVLMRGIVLRLSETLFGTWFALGLSSLLFGLSHAQNPNATTLSSVAIALEAGLLLGATYLTTRRLWLPIALHLSWNFTQGGIFGVSVSGHEASGVLKSEPTGAVLLSGGEFGVEASVVTVVLLTGISLALLWRAHRQGKFTPPRWLRASPEKA